MTLVLSDKGPILMTSFKLNYFPKGSISKTLTMRVRTYLYDVVGWKGRGAQNSVDNKEECCICLLTLP